MANETTSLKLQLARLTSSRSRSRRRFRWRPRTADTCWYHINFGVKARRCSASCSSKSKQGTANCFPIPIFGSLSLTLNFGIRRSSIWIFVIGDVPHAILGSDFHAEFDLLVDCRRARLLNRTTDLPVCGLTPFIAPTNLSVLDTDIVSPFRELLLRHPNKINPQFRSGEVQNHVVHHICTSAKPCLSGRGD
nr:unnamed protein product [Spirometra erinaceieuropaei]